MAIPLSWKSNCITIINLSITCIYFCIKYFVVNRRRKNNIIITGYITCLYTRLLKRSSISQKKRLLTIKPHLDHDDHWLMAVQPQFSYSSTACYRHPMVDRAIFCYLNTTHATNARHWINVGLMLAKQQTTQQTTLFSVATLALLLLSSF